MVKRSVAFLVVLAMMFGTMVFSTGVLAAGDGGSISWSSVIQEGTNGDEPGTLGQVRGMAYGNGVFVIPASNKATNDARILVSSDGHSWTSKAIGGTGTKSVLHDVAHNGANTFVAVGNGASIIISKDGGNTWTTDGIYTTGTSITPTTNIRCVMWDGSKFIAGTNNSLIVTSQDGETWSSTTVNGTINVNSIAFSGDTYIAVGHNSVIFKGSIINDIITWNKIENVTLSARLWGVAYGNSRFIAVGENGQMISSIDNGNTWTSVAPAEIGAAAMGDIKWLDNQFVAVGANGKVLTSATGTSWTASNIAGLSASPKVLYGIASNGSGFYVAAGDGTSGGVIVSGPRAKIVVTPTVLTEAAANQGDLVSGRIDVAVVDATLAPETTESDITITGLPAGMSYTVSNITSSSFTVNIENQALVHTNANDTNITIAVREIVVVRDAADLASGDLTANVAIDFIDVATISTSTDTLVESALNDGSLASSTVIITANHGTFAGDVAQSLTVTGLPQGMNFVVSNVTVNQITFEITGSAVNHANANDTTVNITIPQNKITNALANLTASILLDFKDADFTTVVNTNINTLTANQLFTAGVTVTNNSHDSQVKTVLVIVALYDNANAMRNISYISKNIDFNASEVLSAGFKLPSNIAGYKVKIFVCEGNDIMSSSLLPISDVTIIQ